ncbi:EAL domain-containing protein [Thiocystis violacea]|uniref:EAL domain-containing protein n=1 Tax=Thiocystis violacea TaxID=13725 RepID=UPI00190317FF|nr:EAL domain-containing protein [Thiocystis violacea]MBK1720819.1 REC domain-containing phosphodiesterase [Thiocystis violacea]
MREDPSTGTVLLLMADTEKAEDVRQALAALAIECDLCPRLAEALALVRSQRVDLLLLDTRSFADPGEIESLPAELRALGLSTPTRLAVLAHVDDIRYRLAAMRAGAEALLLLSDPVAELAERVAGMLGVRPEESVRVLVVDDQPVAALFASRVLQGAGMVTERVTNPLQVMEALDRFAPDLVLMDLHMPGASGIELTGIIRSQDRFAEVPIIFLSSELDPSLQMAALRIGGDDFLSKPVAPDRLVESVRNRLKRADERKRRWQGPDSIDPLTRLATRECLLKRLDWLLGQSYPAHSAANPVAIDGRRMGQRAIVYLDIMGIAETLELAAAEVAAHIRPGDLAARTSDRSIAVLVWRESHQLIAEFAQSLVFGVGKLLDERTMGADVGGGWYPITGACKDAVTLLSRAGKAARWSLRGGSDQLGRYEAAKLADDAEDHRLSILEAIRTQRFEILYQPMMTLTGVVGERYELTPRVIVGDGELLPPAEFLPIVLQAGLANRFDRWLLSAGLDVLKAKLDAGEPVLLFIHQTLLGLAKEDWVDWVRDQINDRDLVRLRPVLQFEIAEADQRLELAIQRARQLHKLGIRVCLNGIDFSERSMRVLHAVPSAYVRISRSVIHGPDADSIAWLIQSIKACGARVIATGVDGPAAIARLFGAGVDLIQGPYVQPPSVAMDFEFAVTDTSGV